MGMSWLLVIFVFGWITPRSSQLFYSSSVATVDINPKDVLVFFGETLKVECKLESNTIKISDVHFEIDVNHTTWEVPEENVETDAENRKKVAHIKVNESFIPFAKIACHWTSENDFLNSTFIYPEWPIQEITNFKGIYHFDESIILTWTLGTYVDRSRINVIVDYNPNSTPNQSGNNCSVLRKESCAINNYVGQDILYFRIVVKALRKRPGQEFLTSFNNSTITSEFMVRPDDILKTGIPTDFTVVDQNNTCLTLQWKNPGYFQVSHSSSVFYHIDVKKGEQAKFYTIVDSSEAAITKDKVSVPLCNLTAFTAYTVRLRVKAKVINPWSDPVYIEGVTAEDVPMSGPPLFDTSYNTKTCKDNQREVTVYWNDPPVTSVRGVLTRFEAVVGNKTEPIRKGSNFYTRSLDCRSASNISIYSVTKVGRGLVPSVVHIPVKDDALFEPMDEVKVRIEERLSLLQSKTEKNITVRWNAPDHMKESTLVFYMGQEAASGNDVTFLYDYNVTETSANNRELTIEQVPMSLNMFGYALKFTTGLTRGIEWIDCVYQFDKAPDKPEGLRAIPWEEANSLLITWTTLHCDKNEKVLINKFHLQICRQSNQHCDIVTVESKPALESNQYLAKGLEAGQTYDVNLRSESLNGNMGPWSEPVTAIPKNQSESGEGLLAILLPVFLSLILVGTVFYICGKKFIKNKRNYDRLIKNATGILPEESESGLSPQPSIESGICTSGFSTGTDVSHESPPLHDIPRDDSASVSHGQPIAITNASSVNVGISTSETKHDEGVVGQSSDDVSDQTLITSQMRASNPEMTTAISQGFSNPNSLTTDNSSCDMQSNYIRLQGTDDSHASKNSASYGVEEMQTLDEGYSSPEGLNECPSFPCPKEMPQNPSPSNVYVFNCQADNEADMKGTFGALEPEELTQEKGMSEYVKTAHPNDCENHGRLNQDDEQSVLRGEVVNKNDNRSSFLTAARDFLNNLDHNRRNDDRTEEIKQKCGESQIGVSGNLVGTGSDSLTPSLSDYMRFEDMAFRREPEKYSDGVSESQINSVDISDCIARQTSEKNEAFDLEGGDTEGYVPNNCARSPPQEFSSTSNSLAGAGDEGSYVYRETMPETSQSETDNCSAVDNYPGDSADPHLSLNVVIEPNNSFVPQNEEGPC